MQHFSWLFRSYFGLALCLMVPGSWTAYERWGLSFSFVCFMIEMTNLFPLRRRKQRGKFGRERMGFKRGGDVFKGLVVIIVGRMGARGLSFQKKVGLDEEKLCQQGIRKKGQTSFFFFFFFPACIKGVDCYFFIYLFFLKSTASLMALTGKLVRRTFHLTDPLMMLFSLQIGLQADGRPPEFSSGLVPLGSFAPSAAMCCFLLWIVVRFGAS